MVCALSAGDVILIVGGPTAVKLTVAVLLGPTLLVATAVNVTGPAVSVSELHDQVPVPPSAMTQDWPPGAVNVTLELAVTVPLTTGVRLVKLLGAGLRIATTGSNRQFAEPKA